MNSDKMNYDGKIAEHQRQIEMGHVINDYADGATIKITVPDKESRIVKASIGGLWLTNEEMSRGKFQVVEDKEQ